MSKILFNNFKKKYGEDYQDHYLEQYKLFFSSIEKNNDRKIIANRYYITLNAGLIYSIGILYKSTSSDQLLFILSGFVGFLISIIFLFLINSYKKINIKKFEILWKIEENLPINLYRHENYLLSGNKEKIKNSFYFSKTELLIPAVFCIFYLIVIILTIILF